MPRTKVVPVGKIVRATSGAYGENRQNPLEKDEFAARSACDVG
jgi:hypothetical protein